MKIREEDLKKLYAGYLKAYQEEANKFSDINTVSNAEYRDAIGMKAFVEDVFDMYSHFLRKKIHFLGYTEITEKKSKKGKKNGKGKKSK